MARSGLDETVDTVHEHVHKGIAYSATILNTAVANNGKLNLVLEIPADREIHFRYHLAGGGEATYRLVRSPTITVAGSAITAYNHNDRSQEAAGTVATKDATYSDGIELFNKYLPGGAAGRAVGDQTELNTEWVLKPGLTYVLEITNISGGAAAFGLTGNWYELVF